MKKKFVLFISILIIAISGCINGESGTTPIPTDTVVPKESATPTEKVVEKYVVDPTVIITTPTIFPTESPESPVIPISSTPVIYDIGKSVSNLDTKMTLNTIRYTRTINSKNADQGKQFLVMDVTIENIGISKLSYSGEQFMVLASDEEIEDNYGEDVSSFELIKHFNGIDISPGEKRQGELSFQIPDDIKGLQLKFEYSPGSQSEFFALDR